MSHTRKSLGALVATAAGLALGAPLVAAPAHADPVVDMNWSVDATTTLKTLRKTVAIPSGTLTSQVDLGTGELVGDLSLPQATDQISVRTMPLADVTVAFHQAAPVTGAVDLDAGQAETTATFDVQVVSIRPVFAQWLNLVQGSCTTKTPGVVSLAGPVNLGGVSEFNGAYDLPDFKDCGLRPVTKAVNAALAGKGNTMTATLTSS